MNIDPVDLSLCLHPPTSMSSYVPIRFFINFLSEDVLRYHSETAFHHNSGGRLVGRVGPFIHQFSSYFTVSRFSVPFPGTLSSQIWTSYWRRPLL